MAFYFRSMAKKAENIEELPQEEKEVKKVATKKGDDPIDNRGNASYSAKDIQVLEGLEPVRKRPGMYIGSTGSQGLHHLIWEVFDNSLDEAMAGYAKHITVELGKDGSVTVSDDGRGIPVDIHPKTKKSALETAATTLHAGGKFDGDSYKVSGGLHGVGLSVVNALSTWMKIEVCKDGSKYMQEYRIGKPLADVKKIGKAERGNGTKVTFKPDDTIFSTLEFERKEIVGHLRQQAFLTKGIRIEIIDSREDVPFYYSFYFEGGLVSFVQYVNSSHTPVHKEVFYVHRSYEDIDVETAFIYNDDPDARELSFANNIYTPDGGMHVTGFRTALTRVLNDFARSNNAIKGSDENLTGDDVREGITAIISVKLRDPQFEGQTKARLGTPAARGAVESVVSEGLKEYFEKYSNDAKAIIEKCMLAQKARKAAKAAKETVLRKGMLEGMTLPGKLSDCSSRKAADSELYIVEGDSAGGSAKQGRDRRFQAILPLKGKILNVERARLDKMLVNNEIKSLVIALGTAISDSFDIEKLRYHKVILMTDADVDGAHIRTLLLTLFYRYFRQIIEGGFLYIAQPPLFRLQIGKDVRYVYTPEQKDTAIAEMTAGKKGEANVNVQRYKGLGEMNPDQLWETTMNPEFRTLLQVAIDDAQEADRLFEILMSDEVAPRKQFIQSKATLVKNLDI
ncbi:MAG: hypothetical protein ACD_81C00053G0002 [uncultured bacterium]|uniref:DNA topoisomerase (ATP-hydrolyzing) n=1 Tax=Candidatus Wolfebacteria bacterium GW2011_GWE2_44_13 TaxID=1619017 RepID=A0A0G1HAY7_9BACT|nr:MAG: hypothetical protein ACD_81C00053G0002 [uncultured bacterium]KKT43673.1 MAG: gyrase subunit B protein [Candidatus Wolfebacteria bacterium GW2011_GWE2_44_13]